MRETLARAINSSDLADHEFESSVDKVRALGMAARTNALGVEMLHTIDGLQPKEYKTMLDMLVKLASVQFKCERILLINLCNHVIYEYAFPFCHACDGRGELKSEELVITCQSCGGIGKHRYSDMQRAKGVGVSLEAYNKGWSKRLEIVQRILTDDSREMQIKIKRLREDK